MSQPIVTWGDLMRRVYSELGVPEHLARNSMQASNFILPGGEHRKIEWRPGADPEELVTLMVAMFVKLKSNTLNDPKKARDFMAFIQSKCDKIIENN